MDKIERGKKMHKNVVDKVKVARYFKTIGTIQYHNEYVKKMCSDCIYYQGRCTKNRLVRICVEKGLKNK